MKRTRTLLVVTAVFLAVQVAAWAADRARPKPRRALPPKWSEDVKTVFFDDVREKLTGERPNFGNIASTRPAPGGKVPSTSEAPAGGAGGVFDWSKLITRTALEDEVKNLNLAVQKTVTTPGPFKSGGNRDARRQFSTLAVMFAIIAEFDGDVRWKEQAPGIRDQFAQAGFSCKVGTTQSYNQAKLRRDDLAELVRGSQIDVRDAEAEAKWDKVADRPPLMQRLEHAYNKRLKPWLSSKSDFAGKSEDIYREAQVIAALGEVIQREGFEYWDDETYTGYASEMRDAARELVEAVKLDSYEKASEASGAIFKACTNCHEGYRA